MFYTDILCMSGRPLSNADKKASGVVWFTCFIFFYISSFHVTAAPTKEFGTPIDNTMYKLASEYNDASAQYLVGRNFLYGKTVARDTSEGLKWLKRAADQNHKRALYELGKIYLYGENEIKIDEKKGINYIILAAKNGLSDAQYNLGMHYMNDETNLKINKEAQKWLRLASEQNNSRAQLALGKLLLDQKGHEKEAREWLSSAAEAGELAAAKLLKVVSRANTTAIMLQKEKKVQQDSNTAVTNSLAVANKSLSNKEVLETVSMSNVALENKETTPEEQFQLGLDYFNGDRGLPKKTDKGLEYLRLAAERNHVDAQHSLGMILGGGFGVKEDFDESIKWLKLAQKGGIKSVNEELELIKFKQLLVDEGENATDPKIQFNFANHYLTGDGVEKNLEIASKWFLKAAEQGHHEAQFEIAKMYQKGEGLSQNIENAKHWLIKASEAGVKPAELLLQDIFAEENAPTEVSGTATAGGVIVTKDVELNSADNSTDSANVGDSTVPADPVSLISKTTNIRLITSLTEKSIPTINADEQQKMQEPSAGNKSGVNTSSMSTYLVDANSGDANAQYTLGLKLLNGDGAKQDATEGTKWVLIAANNKHTKAQLQLGNLYLRGDKIEKDYAKAFKWFETAAKAGESKAQLALGDMYKKGVGVARSNVLAIKWYRESANQGNNEAQKRLGGCRVC